MRTTIACFCLVSGTIGLLTNPGIGQAQTVLPDNRFNTQVTATGLNFTIDNGSRSGTNLFHSFSDFSVPAGGSATFNNTVDVQNIFSRVTGGMVSSIDGLIQANGRANLFLLNPSGILFGPNAKLNIGGSFLGTTANSLKFADGVEFSATNPTPLLTMSVPIGLQMSPNSGPIRVNGTGHTLVSSTTNGLAPLVAPSRPGLQLRPNQTIVLLGNSVTLNNGVVGAAQGRVDLGSVSDGWVNLEKVGKDWRLGYQGISAFGDVSLKGRSLLDVGGVNAGSMQVQGRTIQILDGSNLFSQNVGPIAGGLIQVNAAESLQITGTTADAKIRGGIASETLGGGASSQVIVTAPRITVSAGGGILSKSFRQGIGGDVEINASQQLEMLGFAPLNPILTSSLGTATVGPASSGNLRVNAKNINLFQGGVLNAVTLGPGASGSVTVNADTIVLGGGVTPIFSAPSSITVNTFGPGQSGLLTINTRTLDIVRGGVIAGTAYTSGNAGSVILNASESIFVDGYVDSNNQVIAGSINSSVVLPSLQLQQLLNITSMTTANAGSVEINTPRLQLQNGGAVGARNRGQGAGGDVQIKAQLISLKAGLISVETAAGNSGSLDLQANTIDLSNASQLLARANGSGTGGSVRLRTDNLSLTGNSSINAIVNDGNAGEILIDATQRINLDASNIFANTIGKGNAGDIQIMNADRISLTNQSQISNRSTGSGQGGTIAISSRSLALGQNSQINASTLLSDGGNVVLNIPDFLQLRDGSLINAEAGGRGNGGNIQINAPFILGRQNSDIIANAVQGQGGQIAITTQGLFGLKFRNQLTPDNDITASSQFGVNGTVQVNTIGIDPNSGLTALPVDLVDASQQIATGCNRDQGASFVVTGRGGVPTNPIQGLNADRPWQDPRNIPTLASNTTSPTPLIEATTWQLTPQGQPQLIAGQPIVTRKTVTCTGFSKVRNR